MFAGSGVKGKYVASKLPLVDAATWRVPEISSFSGTTLKQRVLSYLTEQSGPARAELCPRILVQMPGRF